MRPIRTTSDPPTEINDVPTQPVQINIFQSKPNKMNMTGHISMMAKG